MALYDPPKPEIDLAIFDHAADEIEHRGWCQNDYTNGHGQVCLVGAFVAANGGDPAKSTSVGNNELRLIHLVPRLGFSSLSKAIDWNDRQRSAGAVIDRLRRAARGEFI